MIKIKWDNMIVTKVNIIKKKEKKNKTIKIMIYCRTSICWTVRSRKVSPFRTAITDFGPWHPMLVPRPPFNLTTTNLSNSAFTSLVSGDGKEL